MLSKTHPSTNTLMCCSCSLRFSSRFPLFASYSARLCVPASVGLCFCFCLFLFCFALYCLYKEEPIPPPPGEGETIPFVRSRPCSLHVALPWFAHDHHRRRRRRRRRHHRHHHQVKHLDDIETVRHGINLSNPGEFIRGLFPAAMRCAAPRCAAVRCGALRACPAWLFAWVRVSDCDYMSGGVASTSQDCQPFL